MDRVEIYIAQSWTGPKKAKGKYIAILALPSKNATKTISKEYEEVTVHKLELLAIRDALSRFNKPCEIAIHSMHGWYQQAFNNGDLEKWQQNGWKSVKGELIKNHEIWSEISNLTECRGLSVVSADMSLGEYDTWLRNEVKKN